MAPPPLHCPRLLHDPHLRHPPARRRLTPKRRRPAPPPKLLGTAAKLATQAPLASRRHRPLKVSRTSYISKQATAPPLPCPRNLRKPHTSNASAVASASGSPARGSASHASPQKLLFRQLGPPQIDRSSFPKSVRHPSQWTNPPGLLASPAARAPRVLRRRDTPGSGRCPTVCVFPIRRGSLRG